MASKATDSKTDNKSEPKSDSKAAVDEAKVLTTTGEARLGAKDETAGGKAEALKPANQRAKAGNDPNNVKVRLNHHCCLEGCEGGPGDVVAVPKDKAQQILEAGGGSVVKDDPETTYDQRLKSEERLVNNDVRIIRD